MFLHTHHITHTRQQLEFVLFETFLTSSLLRSVIRYGDVCKFVNDKYYTRRRIRVSKCMFMIARFDGNEYLFFREIKFKIQAWTKKVQRGLNHYNIWKCNQPNLYFILKKVAPEDKVNDDFDSTPNTDEVFFEVSQVKCKIQLEWILIASFECMRPLRNESISCLFDVQWWQRSLQQ